MLYKNFSQSESSEYLLCMVPKTRKIHRSTLTLNRSWKVHMYAHLLLVGDFEPISQSNPYDRPLGFVRTRTVAKSGPPQQRNLHNQKVIAY